MTSRIPWARSELVALALLVASVGVLPVATAEGEVLLAPGDYAVYTLGNCLPTNFLYSPNFGVDARISVRGCPVTLQWEVEAVMTGDTEVHISMLGWEEDNIEVSDVPRGDEAYTLVYDALTAEYLIHVDLATMAATKEDGTYLGRWSFHLTPAEVAVGEADIVQDWYEGLSLPAEINVTQDLPGGTELALKEAYGMDSFIWAVAANLPFPPGLEQYVYGIEGDWGNLPASGPVYDVTSSLLLYSLGAHYSDILFNLYSIIWWDDAAYLYPDARPSTITLTETNILTPQSGPPGDGGGGGDGGILNNGDQTSPGGFPWATVALLATVAAVAALLLYQWLRPKGHDGDDRRRKNQHP